MIINKRKYSYEYTYIVQGFYCGEWEDETEEETRKEGLARLKEYRENMPDVAHRMVWHEEKLPLAAAELLPIHTHRKG